MQLLKGSTHRVQLRRLRRCRNAYPSLRFRCPAFDEAFKFKSHQMFTLKDCCLSLGCNGCIILWHGTIPFFWIPSPSRNPWVTSGKPVGNQWGTGWDPMGNRWGTGYVLWGTGFLGMSGALGFCTFWGVKTPDRLFLFIKLEGEMRGSEAVGSSVALGGSLCISF